MPITDKAQTAGPGIAENSRPVTANAFESGEFGNSKENTMAAAGTAVSCYGDIESLRLTNLPSIHFLRPPCRSNQEWSQHACHIDLVG